LFGLAILIVNVMAALFASKLAPYPYAEIHPRHILAEPSSEFWLGTDELGRDILSRTIYGARISLQAMTISIGIAVVIGTALGLISGYMVGLWDDIIMRLVDAWLAFPPLILALGIVAVLEPSLVNIMIAIAIVNVPRFIRLIRGEALRLRELEYIQAARSIGATHRQVITRHLLPGVTGTAIVFASLRASQAIITEASLSFLGLGAQPPEPSWGSMVSFGMDYWNHAWWMSFFPGLAIFLTVLALNFIGDALRDALDVRLGKD
jgi:peptide/nickel transport system permease protein